MHYVVIVQSLFVYSISSTKIVKSRAETFKAWHGLYALVFSKSIRLIEIIQTITDHVIPTLSIDHY